MRVRGASHGNRLSAPTVHWRNIKVRRPSGEPQMGTAEHQFLALASASGPLTQALQPKLTPFEPDPAPE
eukprot:15472230-Alexandrium_andersonii.AAC.2